MQPDNDLQTTLSKWPFILGDFLLVGTALAIAILGNWQLTDWQVGACVAAVALGAALFVLPYVVEFQVRVREECEDRAADLRILEKQLLNAGKDLRAIDARMRALERTAAGAGEPDAALTEMIDQKIAQLEKSRLSQELSLQALQKKLEELPKERSPAVNPEVFESIKKRLKELESRAVPISQVSAGAPAETSAGSAAVPPDEKAAPEKPKQTEPQVERSKRSARKRHAPEGARLLQRAITEKSDNSSAAVSRIIDAKATLKKQAQAPEGYEPAKAGTSEAAADSAAPETLEETEPDSKADASQAKPLKKEKPGFKSGLSADAGADSEETAGSGMLFDEDTITSPVTRTNAKKNDAVVTASVFIGIGNKPYLRGSGGGLNWEKGQAMEFQEMGKWRWVAPSNLDAALEVQIYCNDEQADQSGKYTLEPGQKLELSPVF